MYYSGLASISFRDHMPDTILQEAAKANLKYIEWGSDVHVPYLDEPQLKKVASLQKAHGISCCSYGTYFRLGFTPMEELPQYIKAAKLLGTNILRLWAGRKKHLIAQMKSGITCSPSAVRQQPWRKNTVSSCAWSAIGAPIRKPWRERWN